MTGWGERIVECPVISQWNNARVNGASIYSLFVSQTVALDPSILSKGFEMAVCNTFL